MSSRSIQETRHKYIAIAMALLLAVSGLQCPTQLPAPFEGPLGSIGDTSEATGSVNESFGQGEMPITFRLPLEADSFVHFFFDHGNNTDWQCESNTYPGHRGTDFSFPPGMSVNVLAAAGGVLYDSNDSQPDFSQTCYDCAKSNSGCSACLVPNGNFVKIDHGKDQNGNSIITAYLHLKKGTVTQKAKGAWVECGEKIGIVGQSGQATGPHLHFEVQRVSPNGVKTPFDPYRDGVPCGTGASWWSSTLSGVPTSECQANSLPTPPPGKGACCVADACYSNILQQDCVDAGGSYQSDGSTCANASCATPPPPNQTTYTWQPLGSGVSAQVNALTVYNGGLVAGGAYDGVNGVPVGRWNGTSWQAVGSNMNNKLFALMPFDGDLIAGGAFNNAGGVPCNRIARWNGSGWQALGTGMNEWVNALSAFGGELIAGGEFTMADDVSCNRIARWNGLTWQPLGTGLSGIVDVMTVFGGELVAGGSFTTAGGVSVNRIARWNGSTWQSLGTGMNGAVKALAQYKGELIAGGSFTTAGGVTCNQIARWNGANWQPLGTGMNGGFVPALAVYNDELIAGGYFSTAGGVTCHNIARWDGSIWQPLGAGTNSRVKALIVHNNQLIAGGDFTSAGGVSVNYIAKWAPAP